MVASDRKMSSLMTIKAQAPETPQLFLSQVQLKVRCFRIWRAAAHTNSGALHRVGLVENLVVRCCFKLSARNEKLGFDLHRIGHASC
jgi:hypothetical protein